MQGLLLVDKPAGWTSFDVVNYVRKIVAAAEGKKPKNVKVGHCGTLDPFATGLLVLLVGKAYTRRAGELSKLDKTYNLTMRLGETSTTGDPEGEISKASDTIPTIDELHAALRHFQGKIMQTPPAYSAIKVDGQRAYKLARAGKTVTLEPRQVTISDLALLDYAYPDVRLRADVSSGTYVRTLAEDIGRRLNTGAYTVQLERTRIGNYELDRATPVSELNQPTIEQHLSGLP